MSVPSTVPVSAPVPAKPNPWMVEAKVAAATAAALGVGIVIGVLNYTIGHADDLSALPQVVQWLVPVVGAPLVTFLSGWKAQHTPRPDLGA